MATLVPKISAKTLAQARQVWKETIAEYGREVELVAEFGSGIELQPGATELRKTVKAFAKRPKIMGLFDRTEQSYDQEKYQLLVDADDFPAGQEPAKFMRAHWDDEDHVFISVTKVDLKGVVFGYRILVKG